LTLSRASRLLLLDAAAAVERGQRLGAGFDVPNPSSVVADGHDRKVRVKVRAGADQITDNDIFVPVSLVIDVVDVFLYHFGRASFWLILLVKF
jgi:hypothetical protein